MTLDICGQLFPDELEARAGRLEDARADALASLAGPSADQRSCPWGTRWSVSGLVGAGGGARTLMPLRAQRF
jgi:hypothetical protein